MQTDTQQTVKVNDLLILNKTPQVYRVLGIGSYKLHVKREALDATAIVTVTPYTIIPTSPKFVLADRVCAQNIKIGEIHSIFYDLSAKQFLYYVTFPISPLSASIPEDELIRICD